MMTYVNPHAYNTAWQFRADAWSRLEEASDRLSTAAARRGDLLPLIDRVDEHLSALAPLERYWAFPGIHMFAQTQRLFATGAYDKFAMAVAKINQALITESYRTGVQTSPLEGDNQALGATAVPAEEPGHHRSARPYFEVLVVESMTEAQERALRKEVRGWRRADDEFVYELVVVSSGDEALIAARLNVNLQAVVIRRRFSHRSTRALSALAEFVDAPCPHRAHNLPTLRSSGVITVMALAHVGNGLPPRTAALKLPGR